MNPTFPGIIDPSIVSHNYSKGFNDRFYKQGTDDYTNFLAGGYAVNEYYPSIGGMVSERNLLAGLVIIKGMRTL